LDNDVVQGQQKVACKTSRRFVIMQVMKAKLNVSVGFNGQCQEAIEFYEAVFGIKAEIAGRYKDAPTSEGMPEGFDKPEYANYIMHAELKFDEHQSIHMGDFPGTVPFSGAMGISVSYDNVDKAKEVFKKLSQGGKVVQEIGKTFWSECYGNCTDKFGIDWQITVLEYDNK